MFYAHSNRLLFVLTQFAIKQLCTVVVFVDKTFTVETGQKCSWSLLSYRIITVCTNRSSRFTYLVLVYAWTTCIPARQETNAFVLDNDADYPSIVISEESVLYNECKLFGIILLVSVQRQPEPGVLAGGEGGASWVDESRLQDLPAVPRYAAILT